MIGIDIARIKRWFVKNYPTYGSTTYKVVVTVLSQTAIDTTHSLDGVTLSFTVTVYNVQTNAVVVTCSGVYNRMHYGGWNASASADPQAPASLQDDVNDGGGSSDLSNGESGVETPGSSGGESGVNDGSETSGSSGGESGANEGGESPDLSDNENNGSSEPSIGG